MNTAKSPEEIAAAILAGLPDTERLPEPATVEAIMRPLAPISWATSEAIASILYTQQKGNVALAIGPWVEANNVVSTEKSLEQELRIRFLLRDTCTCVLDHLETAMQHAPGPIDQRIVGLLQHEYLQKK